MNLIWQKFAIGLLCFAIAQSAPSTPEETEAARELCMKLHEMSDEELAKLKLDDMNVDKKYKCFGHCMIEKLGFLDETGKLNAEKAQAEHPMSDDEMAKLMACKAEHDLEDDPCEYSFKMMHCVM